MTARKHKNRRGEKISVAIIVLLLLVAMNVQVFRLKQKDKSYAEQVDKLQQQLADETERASELKEREAYMQTLQFVEDMAKSKLGLAYENEIIFKESDE
ncbi:MAG: septum formation initiator family protein [Agathobacter sp.]|uniref:septum formation initiator family protein n=1 Tax=Agathobacter sp. TaxID=2021311 RepID=UPI0025839A1E|nr:septum formation initiator family protein [Agathobacter sp.]MCR5677033.1 septum formation initiator family protein [Agathobacter sp.]